VIASRVEGQVEGRVEGQVEPTGSDAPDWNRAAVAEGSTGAGRDDVVGSGATVPDVAAGAHGSVEQ
jgi:hypothetical protein